MWELWIRPWGIYSNDENTDMENILKYFLCVTIAQQSSMLNTDSDYYIWNRKLQNAQNVFSKKTIILGNFSLQFNQWSKFLLGTLPTSINTPINNNLQANDLFGADAC